MRRSAPGGIGRERLLIELRKEPLGIEACDLALDGFGTLARTFSAGVLDGQLDVLQGTHPRQQVKRLEYESDPPIPHDRLLVG